MLPIEEFLKAIDAAWRSSSAARVKLHLIGSTALMLQTNYERGTKDSDVLRTPELAKDAEEQLVALAGRNSTLHKRHRLYIDVVAGGMPFLPHVPRYHPVVALNTTLRHLEVYVLDIVDVVVTKLKRDIASDGEDIAAMVEEGHVPHPELIARFRSAVDACGDGASAEDIPKYVRRLHAVERDLFGVVETEIELPAWIED